MPAIDSPAVPPTDAPDVAALCDRVENAIAEDREFGRTFPRLFFDDAAQLVAELRRLRKEVGTARHEGIEEGYTQVEKMIREQIASASKDLRVHFSKPEAHGAIADAVAGLLSQVLTPLADALTRPLAAGPEGESDAQ